MFDIIGDVHGHELALRSLLERLGYGSDPTRVPERRTGRRVLFLGDIIDRGPRVRAAVRLVRRMVESGTAALLCGNHEYNAVAWHTEGPDGRPLRPHTADRRAQLAATARDYAGFAAEWAATLAWFRQLPFLLQTPTFRAVHAVWDPLAIEALGGRPAPLLEDRFLHRSASRGTAEHRAVETLLKGIEMDLPRGIEYRDKDGIRRRTTRLRWWHDPPPGGAVDLATIAMPPADRLLSGVTVDAGSLPPLPGYHDERPVFVGHYWLRPPVAPLGDRVACLDYSVADDGLLCAYRLDGTSRLTAERFLCVHPDGTPAE